MKELFEVTFFLLTVAFLMLIGGVVGNSAGKNTAYLRAHGLDHNLKVYEKDDRHFAIVDGQVFWLEPEVTK